MSSVSPVAELVAGARVLAERGLVTAFGHVSVRIAERRLAMTPPRPLGGVGPDEVVEVDLDAPRLPEGAPREAWIHVAITRRRPEAGAVCRAQPEVATGLAGADRPILPLHGQGSFLGPRVPVFEDACLVRDPARADRVADRLGGSPVLVLRGNGAVTVGATVGEAVALMWVLEASARINRIAASAGTVRPLSAEEQQAWHADRDLLTRIWRWLRTHDRPDEHG